LSDDEKWNEKTVLFGGVEVNAVQVCFIVSSNVRIKTSLWSKRKRKVSLYGNKGVYVY